MWKKSGHHIPRVRSIFKAQSSEIRINSTICKEGNDLTPTAILRAESAVKLTSRVAGWLISSAACRVRFQWRWNTKVNARFNVIEICQRQLWKISSGSWQLLWDPVHQGYFFNPRSLCKCIHNPQWSHKYVTKTRWHLYRCCNRSNYRHCRVLSLHSPL